MDKRSVELKRLKINKNLSTQWLVTQINLNATEQFSRDHGIIKSTDRNGMKNKNNKNKQKVMNCKFQD